MPIVLCRIDDRLVHGQVVEGWLRVINANHIVVVSDEVANDKMQQTLLTMAVPNNVNVESFSVYNAAKQALQGAFDKDRILLLFSNPKDVLRFINYGIKLSSINVGGMHYVPGKKQIFRTLSVDEADISCFNEINKMGIELEGRVLPDDTRINVMEVIEKEMKQK